LLITNYPNSILVDNASYNIANSYQEQALNATVTTDRDTLNQQALDTYNTFLTNFSATSSYADNAHYQIGKVYYDQGSFDLAITQFTSLTTPITPLPYIDNSALDESWYFLGRSYESLSLNNDAIQSYLSIINNYPFSFYEPLARNRLNTLGFVI